MKKKTMKLEDMKFLYEELVNLEDGGYVHNTDSIHILQYNQQRMYDLAYKLNERYLGYGEEEINQSLATNSRRFLEHAGNELAIGSVLNQRNYLMLANLTSSMAHQVQAIKLRKLIESGHWEGVTLEDVIGDVETTEDYENQQATNQKQAREV